MALAAANGKVRRRRSAGLQQAAQLIDQIDATAAGTQLFGHSSLMHPHGPQLTPTLTRFGQTGRTLSR